MAGVQPKLSTCCSPSVRTVTGWTIFFLVLLRVAIGWHFLYEGAWKIHQDDWRATGYLANASGPFRPYFRKLINDIDGFDRLGIDQVIRDDKTGKVIDVVLDPSGKDDPNNPDDKDNPLAIYRRMDQRAALAVSHYGLSDDQKEIYADFIIRKKHGIPDELNVRALFKAVDIAEMEARLEREGWLQELVDKLHEAKKHPPTESATKLHKLLEDYKQKIAEGNSVNTAPILEMVQAIFDDLDKTVKEHLHEAQKGKPDPAPTVIVPEGKNADDLSWLTEGYLNGVLDQRYNALRDHYKIDESKYADDPAKLKLIKAEIEDIHQSTYGWRYRDQKKIGSDRDPNNVDKIYENEDLKLAVIDYIDLCDQIQKVEEDERKRVGRPAVDFDSERLDYDYQKRNKARAALLARIEIPLNDIDPKKMGTFNENVLLDLNEKQLAAGNLPPEWSQTEIIDWANMLGLAAIGLGLILGCFTRLAALGGVCMLAMFYLCMPPWPGLEANMTAEGHALIVNKNMVEAIALLVIASSRVGRWWGIDGILGARRMRRMARQIHEAATTAA